VEDPSDQEEANRYQVHKAVFDNDLPRLSSLLRINKDGASDKKEVQEKDPHGNTPLHLAVMLGRKECVQLLLAHHAPVKLKNKSGWSALAEAISYGDRQTISSLLRRLKQQAKTEMNNRRPEMMAALEKLGDYTLELKWDFSSWVPLVSRLLPSDICKISKRGSAVRLDTTLVDFNEMRWERGDISFLYRGDRPPQTALHVLDNKAKVYQVVRHDESELEFEDEVDLLMSSDVVAAQISTKPITFSRAQSGWFFRADRNERIGNYTADFYVVNGMSLEARKRREHLSEEDLQKNKAILDNFSKGSPALTGSDGSSSAASVTEPPRRETLPPPAPPTITWDEYLSSPAPPVLGRQHVSKDHSKQFKATIAMSEDFPLDVEMLLAVLEVIAPQFRHFNKLRDFVSQKLPPGFPIQVNIPVLPTVSAKVTFTDFKWRDDLGDELFTIPDDFREDPYRFPDL